MSGQLLGMDITLGGVTTLEVTSCFPMPLQTEAEDAEEGEFSAGVWALSTALGYSIELDFMVEDGFCLGIAQTS